MNFYDAWNQEVCGPNHTLNEFKTSSEPVPTFIVTKWELASNKYVNDNVLIRKRYFIQMQQQQQPHFTEIPRKDEIGIKYYQNHALICFPL